MGTVTVTYYCGVLNTGAIYALATLGIIIVFRTNFIINFAQGTMGMFGAFIVTVCYFQK